MHIRLVYTICFLVGIVGFSNYSISLSSNSNENYVTEWEVFRRAVEGYRIKINKSENVENARQAEKRGREAFLKGDLQKADFHGYGDAIAWLPRPEYFFIVGDINLRYKLSLHSESIYATYEYKECWDKYLFALDVKRSIGSNFERGFGLAEELNLSGTKNSKIYRQAMVNASCFARLTSKYSEGVGPQCVPLEEVKACLGRPLLFLYH